MKSRRLWIILALASGIGLLWLGVRSGLLAANAPILLNGIAAPPLPTLDPGHVAQGKVLYAQHCANCHGAQLEGAADWKTPLADGTLPPPPHDSSGHTWHHPDALLVQIVAKGGDPAARSKMPAFQDRLSEAEMIAILDYIKSQWGQDEREFQWWMTAVGDQQQRR